MNRGLILVLIFPILFINIFELSSGAAELSLATGLTQQEGGNFRYLSYRAELGFSTGSSTFVSVVLGTTHPNQLHGYLQYNPRIGVVHNWTLDVFSFLDLFAGIGVGAWMDRVSAGGNISGSVIPSVAWQMGFRFGGKGFGAVAGFDDYMGVYNLYHLPLVVWPNNTFFLGLYASL